MFGDVMTRAIEPLDICELLSDGDIYGANPVVAPYLYDPDTDAFVIAGVLHPGQISVSAKDDSGHKISAVSRPSLLRI
jgi:hypothetical protein